MSNPTTPPDHTKRPHRDRRPRRHQRDNYPDLREACLQGALHVVASLRGHGRGGVALAPLLVVVLGVAACGGGSSNNSGATSSAGTTTMSRDVEYAQCMRAHGVTNFPDPIVGARGKESIDFNSPTFQAAQAACRQYAPPGAPTPAQSAQREADLLRFAQCMRSHGVPNFPDPNSKGDFNFTGTGINRDSPAVLAAGRTCLTTANGAVQPPSATGQ